MMPAELLERWPHEDWPRVELGGQVYRIAPVYVAPVGIGEAIEIARAYSCELPSPALVDAIWEAADLRLEPLPRKHDGTPRTMASKAAYDDQARRIEEQIAGREFCLLAGTHKDVSKRKDSIGLYGWHRSDGRIIQPFFSGHALAWKDYSQGLRLVKRHTP
jgi:hypothetical protein